MQAMNDKMHETKGRAPESAPIPSGEATMSGMNAASNTTTTNEGTDMSDATTTIYIEALNESSITFVRDLSRWGWDIKGPGWEVCSPFGEVRAFPIGDRKAAEQWRADEVSEYVALRLRTLA